MPAHFFNSSLDAQASRGEIAGLAIKAAKNLIEMRLFMALSQEVSHWPTSLPVLSSRNSSFEKRGNCTRPGAQNAPTLIDGGQWFRALLRRRNDRHNQHRGGEAAAGLSVLALGEGPFDVLRPPEVLYKCLFKFRELKVAMTD